MTDGTLHRAVFVPPDVPLPVGVEDARDFWDAFQKKWGRGGTDDVLLQVFVDDARTYYQTCDEPARAAEWGPSEERTRCVVVEVTREKSWPERWW